MSHSIIAVENFEKSFGTKKVIDGLSFDVFEGDIFAYLGVNGAGKTTTIRTLLNIYQPDKGTLLINGERYTPGQTGMVGYLPEERGIYVNEKVIDVMTYFGRMKGLTKNDAEQWVKNYLERVELSDQKNTEIKKLSSGQQQKIQVGVALLGEPKILILDEPTKGLDPMNRSLFFEILMELRKKGTTIMMSSHHFEEIEKLCNRLLILKDGKAQIYGNVNVIKNQFRTNKLKLRYDGEFPVNDSLFSAEIEEHQAKIYPKQGVNSNDILGFLIQQKKLDINSFEAGTTSLEEIFLQIAK